MDSIRNDMTSGEGWRMDSIRNDMTESSERGGRWIALGTT